MFICSTASAKSSLNSCTTAPADFTLSIRPTPWPTKYVTRSRACAFPAAAARSIELKASRLMMLCSGIGSAPGLSGPRSHASVHTERNCRAGFPVRPFERIASREDAAIIFSRKISVVSDSTVASHTEPVQAPAAPIAMHAAICRPVMMPPAASTGTSQIGLIALITSGTSTHGRDLAAMAAGLGALRDQDIDTGRDLAQRMLLGTDERCNGHAMLAALVDHRLRRHAERICDQFDRVAERNVEHVERTLR